MLILCLCKHLPNFEDKPAFLPTQVIHPVQSFRDPLHIIPSLSGLLPWPCSGRAVTAKFFHGLSFWFVCQKTLADFKVICVPFCFLPVACLGISLGIMCGMNDESKCI